MLLQGLLIGLYLLRASQVAAQAADINPEIQMRHLDSVLVESIGQPSIQLPLLLLETDGNPFSERMRETLISPDVIGFCRSACETLQSVQM